MATPGRCAHLQATDGAEIPGRSLAQDGLSHETPDKPRRAVFIDDATHQLDRKSDRITLLTEIEKFLLDNLGPGATGGS